jgi:two-component system chemotaxis response regulator CheY
MQEEIVMPKVMIVDDSLFTRNHLKKLLTDHGYETVLAENGEQAVKVYRSARPDVVLMDMIMPKMGGMDALAQIRLFDPAAKIIMLTAMEHKLAAARAIHMGAADFIVKPAMPSLVLARLEKILKRNR